MRRLIKLLITVILVKLCSGQRYSFGECPDFPVIKDFKPEQYLGKWFEYSNYFAFFQLFGKCVTATYTPTKKEGFITVLNQAIDERNGNPTTALGSAELPRSRPNGPLSTRGSLIVNFDGQPFFTRASNPNYHIIDTDYNNFSIVYSCNEKFFGLKSELLWVLTRERHPPKELVDHVYKTIRYSGLDTRRLRRTDQKTCGYNH